MTIMRAIKGRMEGNVIHLSEPVSEITSQEVIVLVPTSPDDPKLDLMFYAGIWADMQDDEWKALQQSLEQGVPIGEERP